MDDVRRRHTNNTINVSGVPLLEMFVSGCKKQVNWRPQPAEVLCTLLKDVSAGKKTNCILKHLFFPRKLNLYTPCPVILHVKHSAVVACVEIYFFTVTLMSVTGARYMLKRGNKKNNIT
jgi:hypothetical protein